MMSPLIAPTPVTTFGPGYSEAQDISEVHNERQSISSSQRYKMINKMNLSQKQDNKEQVLKVNQSFRGNKLANSSRSTKVLDTSNKQINELPNFSKSIFKESLVEVDPIYEKNDVEETNELVISAKSLGVEEVEEEEDETPIQKNIYLKPEDPNWVVPANFDEKGISNLGNKKNTTHNKSTMSKSSAAEDCEVDFMLPNQDQFDEILEENENALDDLHLSNVFADRNISRWNFKLSNGYETEFQTYGQQMKPFSFKQSKARIANIKLYAFQHSLSGIEMYDEDWNMITRLGQTTSQMNELEHDMTLAYGEKILGVQGKVTKLPIQVITEFQFIIMKEDLTERFTRLLSQHLGQHKQSPYDIKFDDSYNLDLKDLKAKCRKAIKQYGLKEVTNMDYPDNEHRYSGFLNNNGKRHGWGEQRWKDGSRYEGEWQNDRICGYGKKWKNNKEVFEGEWKDDQLNGLGKYISSDGTQYVGNWVNNKKSGMGTFKWPDWSNYTGQFKDNVIHGIGEYYWVDGSYYIGEWSNAEKNGKGVFTRPDGYRYEGDFSKNKRHGWGLAFSPDGSEELVCFKNGKQIKVTAADQRRATISTNFSQF